MRRLVLVAALVAGCSRDLTIPSVRPLTVTPAAASVAPRGRLTLSADGGAGGYRFTFDGGARPSGDDATLDPVTGAYRAGSRGSGQDVVIATDSAGARAVARIAVGPRLVVTPSAAVTSPGGALEVVASGGSPPYTFTLADAQPATSLVAAGEDRTSFRAGALGDRTERVVVTDATWDAADPSAPSAGCEVRIGSPVKVYANAANAVPPHDTIDFLAVGGQPAYAFDFANRDPATGLPPSGGSIDPVTGRYRAGATGTAPGTAAGHEVVDLVVARDAHGQTSAPWRVVLGPPLGLSLADAILSPGRAVRLTASGGKPPYTFGFAPRGNHSRGTVDAVTGVYVPGAGQGTSDALAVTDATGVARATIERAPAVGYVEIPVGDHAGMVLPATLRGEMRVLSDGSFRPRQDALVFHYAPTEVFAGLTSVLFPAASAPEVEHGHQAGMDLPFVADVNGDGHDDVVSFGHRWWSNQVTALVADVTGNLSVAASAALPTSDFWYQVSASPSSAEPRRFYTSVGCGGPPATGITVVDAGPTGLSTLCLAHPDAAELASNQGPLVAADLDGDGAVDLAWMLQDASHMNQSVRVSYRAGGFLPAVTLAPPSGCFLLGRMHHSAQGAFARLAAPGAAKTSLAVVLSCGLEERVAVVDGGTSASRVPSFAPSGGAAVGAGGLVASFRPAADAGPTVASWSNYGGSVVGVRFDAAGASTVDLAPALPMNVEWAGFPDVDGDGIPDLLAAGSNPSAYLMLGDGDGRFGFRARVRGATAWAPAGDLDGDGVEDAVVATSDRSLAILLGGRDQLAWLPGIPLAAPVEALTVAETLGAGQPAVTYQDPQGMLHRVPIAADLTFGTPRPVTANKVVPPGVTHRLADLGGAAPGPDLWWLNGPPGTDSGMGGAVFDSAGTAQIVEARTPYPYVGCGLLPSGVGAFRVVAVCPDAAANGIAILTGEGYYIPSYDTFTAWAGLPGGTQRNAEVIAAGRTDDGAAIFIATPSGPAGARHRYAVTVTRNPLAAAVQDLGAEDVIPARLGLVADVDGNGVPDLVVVGNGKGRVLLGAASGGGTAYSLGPTFRASGMPDAALHLGAIPGADLVMHMGDDLVLLRHDGGGQLR